MTPLVTLCCNHDVDVLNRHCIMMTTATTTFIFITVLVMWAQDHVSVQTPIHTICMPDCELVALYRHGHMHHDHRLHHQHSSSNSSSSCSNTCTSSCIWFALVNNNIIIINHSYLLSVYDACVHLINITAYRNTSHHYTSLHSTALHHTRTREMAKDPQVTSWG